MANKYSQSTNKKKVNKKKSVPIYNKPKPLSQEELEALEAKKKEEELIIQKKKEEAEKAEKIKKRQILFDKLLYALPLILCILLVISTIVTTIAVMVKQNVFEDYDSFEQYTIKDEKELLSLEGTYYVYIYSENCSHCREIKKTVLTYIETYNHRDTKTYPKLYLYQIEPDDQIVSSEGSNLIGVSNWKDLKVYGTPTLITVTNKMVNGALESAEKIEKLLSK